jgi:hypothetical protein
VASCSTFRDLRGCKWLEPGDAVTGAELARCAAAEGVEVVLKAAALFGSFYFSLLEWMSRG